VEISGGAIIKCDYELSVKVVNKSNSQSKTPSRVTDTRDNINDKVTISLRNHRDNKIREAWRTDT
jgi:hypothetical protein